jgi:CheY-like chemotaxis protein
MTKILLVEDDKSLREIYGVRLLAEGYDIVSAGDGEEALAMAIKERPTLIISDVMMPKISGFDMLDILRSTTETKDIKVIIMTALSSEDQRTRGEGLGADRYLVKSQVGIEDVVRTVHEVLADAPVSGAAPSRAAFGPTGPSAAPRPAPPVAPRPAAPSAAPQAPTPAPAAPVRPAAPQWPPTPPAAAPEQPVPAPEPTPPAAPTSPPAAPSAGASSLPVPTAPFSTTRPAGLGDRIIHPLAEPESKPDFNNLMAQELNSTPGAQPPAAAPSAPSQPPQPAAPDLKFEETPLPSAPQTPNPFEPKPPQA